MSWYIESSVLPGPLPTALSNYSPYHFDQTELPNWMHERKVIHTCDAMTAAWEVFTQWLPRSLGAQAVSKPAWGVLVFPGTLAVASIPKLTPLPAYLYHRVKTMAEANGGWSDEFLISSLLSLRDETKLLLTALTSTSVGALRIYEWGKF